MLEQKIEELTKAVNKLIEVMEQQPTGVLQTAAPKDAVIEDAPVKLVEKPAPEIEEPESVTDATDAESIAETAVEPITDDKLRLACTAAVKANPGNRTTIKDKLADYGVTKVGDLPTDGDTRAEFLKFVTSLGA